jgi:recombination associated protein RdgC
MFKNLFVYKFSNTPSVAEIEKSLDAERFVPCGKSQEKAIGWVDPRGEPDAPLAESIGGHLILRLKIETKSVPGSVVSREAQERANQIEKQSGRKPGKKEMREIKEDVKMSLLPHAFSKESTHWIWIDQKTGLMLVDASAQSAADDAVTMVVKSIANMQVAPISTKTSPLSAMSNWLFSQDAPAGFSIDRECELKAHDESKAVVKFSKHNLDRDDVRKHIEEGKLPTRLAMTWDSRVSFALTHNFQLKKIVFLDVVFEDSGENDSVFDSEVAIATGELCKLLPDLFDALGGLVM